MSNKWKFKGELRKSLKSLRMDTTLLDKLKIRDEIANLLMSAEEMGREISASSGIRLHDVIPNGYMIVEVQKLGKLLCRNWRFSDFSLVFVPKRVDRINKITRVSTYYYELTGRLWTAALDIGAGAGGGGRAA